MIAGCGCWKSRDGRLGDCVRAFFDLRPGLDSKRRELCTLAAIAMLHAERQLHAHLRGALNTGSTREDVDAVLALIEADLPADRALRVWELWADVRERNL